MSEYKINQKIVGCEKIKDCGVWGIRRCGNFEDLKHSDHYIYCLDCIALNSEEDVQ